MSCTEHDSQAIRHMHERMRTEIKLVVAVLIAAFCKMSAQEHLDSVHASIGWAENGTRFVWSLSGDDDTAVLQRNGRLIFHSNKEIEDVHLVEIYQQMVIFVRMIVRSYKGLEQYIQVAELDRCQAETLRLYVREAKLDAVL